MSTPLFSLWFTPAFVQSSVWKHQPHLCSISEINGLDLSAWSVHGFGKCLGTLKQSKASFRLESKFFHMDLENPSCQRPPTPSSESAEATPRFFWFFFFSSFLLASTCQVQLGTHVTWEGSSRGHFNSSEPYSLWLNSELTRPLQGISTFLCDCRACRLLGLQTRF